jgi:hypothetical protein
MNRMARRPLATALAVVVGLGVSAVPAQAAGDHAHPRAGHGKALEHRMKADRLERRLDRVERRLTRKVAIKDRFLVRVSERRILDRLDAEAVAAIRAALTADRALLQGHLATVTSATTLGDARAAARDLRRVRPERYNTILSQHRTAARPQARLSARAETVAELQAASPTLDLTGVEALHAAAVTELEAARARLMTFGATTSRRDLRTGKRDLMAVWRTTARIAAQLEEAKAAAESTETGSTSTSETDTEAGSV